jgi:hypothetical protein
VTVIKSLPVAALLLIEVVPAGAQTTVGLPNSGQTTTLTASVSEQARVTVPAGVSFNVTNGNASSSPVSVSVDSIVLATSTKRLKVSLMAAAASFTPPEAGATTWSASNVSWTNANGGPGAWVNAVRNNGTLSSGSFVEVATCHAGVTSCFTTGLTFTLAANSTVQRSGNHTLVVTWKFESIGS